MLLFGTGLAGIARGDELTGSGPLAGKQLVWFGMSVLACLAAALWPYRAWKHRAYGIYALCVALLVLVYLFPARGGARRWIPLGVFSLQPSEFAKLATIGALAVNLSGCQAYRRFTGLFPPFLIACVPMALVLKEPDLGTAMLFLPTLYAMLFAAGAKLRHLAAVGLLSLLALPFFWSAMSAEQRSRVTALFLQRDGSAPEVGRADGFHLHQSKQVLALGGLAGSQFQGTAVDDPLAYYLPASRTDFVFCMVGERFGFLGCLAVILLYLVLFSRGLAAGVRARDPFGKLLAVGIVSLLASQTIINLAMTVGLAPITGITLPLLSYGGSSLLSTAVAIGLLMNVALRPGYEIGPEPFSFGGTRR
jgi:cell division protein FtsW (lipid II flippase)